MTTNYDEFISMLADAYAHANTMDGFTGEFSRFPEISKREYGITPDEFWELDYQATEIFFDMGREGEKVFGIYHERLYDAARKLYYKRVDEFRNRPTVWHAGSFLLEDYDPAYDSPRNDYEDYLQVEYYDHLDYIDELEAIYDVA